MSACDGIVPGAHDAVIAAKISWAIAWVSILCSSIYGGGGGAGGFNLATVGGDGPNKRCCDRGGYVGAEHLRKFRLKVCAHLVQREQHLLIRCTDKEQREIGGRGDAAINKFFASRALPPVMVFVLRQHSGRHHDDDTAKIPAGPSGDQTHLARARPSEARVSLEQPSCDGAR
jgi:hypothetical protein